ncbi:putative lipoprotein [Pseudomonas sp. BAY1663]|uniref:RsiV family protein n=1 Tax=Pseudomonas sp. BAY1663 TaxID=1439940 RepID=UPI00042DECA2|nr:RsiV family protein [Pseudomonas sp. BAY1663]EXF45336.1 putative lipoprotein [Pseudomonas sp. BAY1663]
MTPSATTRNAITLVILTLLLSACQHLVPERSVEVHRNLSEQRPAGCHEESCPLVNIDSLQFADEPALDRLIDERLRRMTVNAPDDRLPESLQGYQERFLSTAEPNWSSYLQAKLREQHGDLLVVELSSYLYTGGAHGMPGRGFINYDRKRDRELRLEDVLIPGQEGSFWRVARQAHQRWLAENGHAQDAEFIDFWPFQQTAHIALLKDRVLLKYDVYSIAPYSSGHPELFIPHDQLKGILKAEYL